VHTAGDINGDGYADLIVGADFADSNGSDSGAAYVVFGHGGSFALQPRPLHAETARTDSRSTARFSFDRAGYSVSSAGDVNGDGVDDLLVGAIFAGKNGSYNGAGYVIFGHTGSFSPAVTLSIWTATTASALWAPTCMNLAGFSISSAGDINGDGFDDGDRRRSLS